MQSTIKKISFTVLALHNIASVASPYFGIRSQGVNAARDLAGISNFVNLESDCLYGTVYGLFEYTRSFDAQAMARCLFCPDLTEGACCKSGLTISGSQSPNRGSSDWLADYFGLPTDYKSTIQFRPQIQNYIIDLGIYIGLDEWAPGLYFKVHAPITHTKWDLDFLETVSSAGSNAYPPGYFNGAEQTAPTTVGVSRGNLVTNFTDFITGAQVPSLPQASGSTFPASTFYYLANAICSPQALVKTGVAEVTAVFGWNWAKEDYHAGVNLRLASPTGTKPDGIYAFEPIVGNGHHWEFGGGLTGHYEFWRDEEKERHMGLYVDANFTHLFTARQHRTFDLKGKPNSRYMLAEQIGSSRLTPQLNASFPNVEFQSIFAPLSNLTTMDVNVSIGLQADMVFMFNFTSGPYTFDFGYDFWATTCERITKNGSSPSSLDDGMTWALKGDASVIGFQDDSATTAAFAPVRLAATESEATIHAGTNFPASGTTSATTIIAGRANPNIDSPAAATTNGTPSLNVVINPAALSATNPQTNSSTNPVYITLSDVDFAGIKGLSNKLFTHFSYTWETCNDWTPYLGFGGEAEFGLNTNGCSSSCSSNSSNSCSAALCSSGCSGCERCSVSQWGIWIKGGVNF